MQRDQQNYIVIEMQTTGASTIFTPNQVFTDWSQALHAFLLAEAAAVISTVPVHTVCLMSDDGRLLKTASYMHEG